MNKPSGTGTKVSRRGFLGAATAGMLVSTGQGNSVTPASASAGAEQPQGWWMRQPIRWIQTNLRATNAALDPEKFITEIAAMDGNALLMSLGGINAFYPSQVQYQQISPYMPKGQDTFGEVLRLAHARNIRVIGRFDLSKTHKDAYDAHPEWFFQKAGGEPVIYNGLYQTCVNGGWYHEKTVEMVGEALDRYDVDGLFFNMFGNPASDYSGHPLGLCQCENCRRLFRERFHRDLPERPDADYEAFMHDANISISETVRNLMRAKRPNAALVGTSPEIGDMVFSEANTAVKRPLPLWPYSAADHVNFARNTYPEKMAVNQCMSFIDYAWRFSVVPQAEIRTRLWQNVANGGAAAFNMHGTISDQQDRTALESLRPVYRWLKEHENYYVGQYPCARVLLWGKVGGTLAAEASYRGFFRLLSEDHLPFGVVGNLNWLGKREVNLVIASGPVPAELNDWVSSGGRLLIASPTEPPMNMGSVVKLWKDPDGAYFRLRDKSLFPSMKDIDVTFMYGDYLEVDAHGPLTFIPPSMYGPPELVNIDWKDTDSPGLIVKEFGKGKVAWLPWDLGALYYRHSSEAHARLVHDLIDHLLPQGRQLKSNAHPLVDITLMKQGDHYLVHLVSIAGHSETGYFKAMPMSNIQVNVQGDFRSAHAVVSGARLALSHASGYSTFTVPTLGDYELIDLA